jgi:hypothetical protein
MRNRSTAPSRSYLARHSAVVRRRPDVEAAPLSAAAGADDDEEEAASGSCSRQIAAHATQQVLKGPSTPCSCSRTARRAAPARQPGLAAHVCCEAALGAASAAAAAACDANSWLHAWHAAAPQSSRPSRESERAVSRAGRVVLQQTKLAISLGSVRGATRVLRGAPGLVAVGGGAGLSATRYNELVTWRLFIPPRSASTVPHATLIPLHSLVGRPGAVGGLRRHGAPAVSRRGSSCALRTHSGKA